MNISIRMGRAIAAGAALGLLVAGMTACSNSDMPTSSEEVTVSYAYWDPNMTEAFKAAAKTFHDENPNITIQVQQVPFTNYFTKLNTQLTSKSAPDVFWLQNIQFPLYSLNDQLADLSSYMSADSKELSGISKSAMDTYQVEGKQYAVPWQVNTFGLYYNKKLFAEAGVPAPTDSWTWDDVAAAAAKITDTSKGVYGIVAPVWAYGTYYQTMYAYGADIVTDGGTGTDYDSPEAIKGLDFWAELSRNGYSPSVAQLNDTPQDQWFQSGKAAMQSTGSWSASIHSEALGADLGIARLPRGTVDVSGAATTANAVAASSKHIPQAYKWVEFLASPKGQIILNKTAGAAAGVPANSSAVDTWLEATGNPDSKVFVDAISTSKPLPATKNTKAWSNEEPAILSPAWNGAESTADVAKKMAEVIRAEIAKE